MVEICTVGVSFRSAPLALRELLAVSADGVADKLRLLKRQCGVPEAAMVSTCNRTEVYCVAPGPEAVANWLVAEAGCAEVGAHVYRLREEAAVRHVFRVASGLDSQLVGEPEITGQVRRFARAAREAGGSGAVINRLMDGALACAKAVRSRTEIGRHSLSYPALALRAAAGIFDDVRELRALFVGTGDMTVAGLSVFADRGVAGVGVAGRNAEKTAALARRFGAEGMPIGRLPEALARFDVVLSATASAVPIIGKGAVESALRARRRKPMMFADLAVPRDLEPEIAELDDVFVYRLDQFGQMAADSEARRRAAGADGEAIVAAYAAEFGRWRRARGAAGRVRGYREAAVRIRDEETAAALARLARGDEPGRVVEAMGHKMAGRLLHAPTMFLREGGAGAGADDWAGEKERGADDVAGGG